MKSILLSKTFWVQIMALVVLVFPPVKAWFDSNPVEYLAVLAAVNVLLRWVTSGAVSILPDKHDDDDGTVEGGRRLMGWLLLAGLAGSVGISLPACSSAQMDAAGQVPIRATYQRDGVTLGYSSKGGLMLDVDQSSGK